MSDVMAVMSGLEYATSGYVSIAMTIAGRGSNQRLLVSARLSVPIFAAAGYASGIIVDAEWPHPDHSTLEGLYFSLVLKLDAEAVKMYEQLGMPLG